MRFRLDKKVNLLITRSKIKSNIQSTEMSLMKRKHKNKKDKGYTIFMSF